MYTKAVGQFETFKRARGSAEGCRKWWTPILSHATGKMTQQSIRAYKLSFRLLEGAVLPAGIGQTRG